MVYGEDTMLLEEIKTPIWWRVHYNEENIQAKLGEFVDLIEEIRNMT